MSKEPKISRQRSFALREFQKSMSDVNKYLSYYVFISSQFLKQNEDKIGQLPTKLTSEVFTENDLASQFDVKLHLLEAHTIETDQFIFDSLFIYINTALENYYKDSYGCLISVQHFLAQQNRQLERSATPIKDLGEGDLLSKILANVQLKFDEGITDLDILTLDYFRYRRNTMIHRDINLRFSGTTAEFITGYGKSLNAYWSSKNTQIFDFDFESKELIFKKRNEIVGVLNILRDILPRFEERVNQFIADSEWIEYLMAQFKLENKTYDINVKDNFIKGFARFALIKLNKIFQIQDIEQTLKNIQAR